MLLIGADVGATNARVMMEVDGIVAYAVRMATTNNYTIDLGHVATAARELAGDTTPDAVAAVVACKHSQDGGLLVAAGQLTGFVGQAFAGDLREAIGCARGISLNDTAGAALAEAISGAGVNFDTFVFVVFSSGINCCTVVRDSQGKPILVTGEFGHSIANFGDGFPCGCGRQDCLEANIGGKSVEWLYGMPAEKLPRYTWADRLPKLAVGIYNIATVTGAEDFVLGGAQFLGDAWMLPVLEEMINAMSSVVTVRLHLAVHADDAGLVGAIEAARMLVTA